MPFFIKTYWYEWAFLISAAVISFFIFSVPFYPYLDSDLAVHVYMAETFRIPQDLYFWNQDRLGSLSPLLAYLLNLITPLNAAWSISIVEWLFLAFGCLLSWHFVPSPIFRMLIVLLWFFPNFEFRYLFLPSHPYNEQMAMVLFSLVLFDKAFVSDKKTHLLPFITLFAFISIWISEFSVLFYLLLVPAHFKNIHFFFKSGYKTVSFPLLGSLAICIPGICFIFYLKNYFPEENSYMTDIFSSPAQTWETITLLFSFITNNLTLQGYSIYNSLLLYSLLPLILIRFVYPIRSWALYFLLIAIAGSVLLVVLRWVAISGIILKYFVPVVLCFWIFLFCFPHQRTRKSSTIFAILSTVSVIASCLTFMYPYKYHYQESITYNDLKKVSILPYNNFMGDYWHSYVLGIAAPDKIHTTPHIGQNIRHTDMQATVLSADTLYVVGNNWLDEFPDTLRQDNFAYTPADTSFLTIGPLRLRLYAAIK